MKHDVAEKILPQSPGLGRPLFRAGRPGKFRNLLEKILKQLKGHDVGCLKRWLQDPADLGRLGLGASNAGKK